MTISCYFLTGFIILSLVFSSVAPISKTGKIFFDFFQNNFRIPPKSYQIFLYVYTIKININS